MAEEKPDDEIPIFEEAVLLENFFGLLMQAISEESLGFDKDKVNQYHLLTSSQKVIDFNVAFPKSIQEVGGESVLVNTGIVFNGLPDRSTIKSSFIEVKLSQETEKYINEPTTNIPKGQMFVVLNAKRYMHEDKKENNVVMSLAVLSKRNAQESYLFDENFTNQKFGLFVLLSKYHPAGKGSLTEDKMEKLKKSFPKLDKRMADIIAKGTSSPDRSFGFLIPLGEVDNFLIGYKPRKTPMEEIKELWEENDEEL